MGQAKAETRRGQRYSEEADGETLPTAVPSLTSRQPHWDEGFQEEILEAARPACPERNYNAEAFTGRGCGGSETKHG